LGIALTDAELKAAEAWIRWVQELDEYSTLAAAHDQVTAGYESNHDIDDPQFYVQVTAKAVPELVDEIAKTVPADLPYEVRQVGYSSAQVFAAALAVEAEINGGPSVGLTAALDSIGLGEPTQVMVSPSSQAVRVGVDRSGEDLLSLDVQRRMAGGCPVLMACCSRLSAIRTRRLRRAGWTHQANPRQVFGCQQGWDRAPRPVRFTQRHSVCSI
jgi:hypothetical protein